MSSETLDKLSSRHFVEPNSPTANQILHEMEEKRQFTDLIIRVGFDIPEGVLEGFIKKGVLNEERFTKFVASVGRFVDNRGIEELGNLTTDFIRKNGSINENKYRRKIKKE